MLKIAFTNQYLRDLRRAERRRLPREELDRVVLALAQGKPLPAKHKDHALKGDLAAYRECHIRPDWLLIYRVDRQVLTLVLIRTGSHADLF